MPDLRVSFPKPCDEPWEAMAPAGCDRVCDRCARVIHDLRHYTVDEVEALLQSDPDTCVRASVANDGTIALKHGGARRMLLAIGAIGALTAADPLLANEKAGAITGRVGVPMVVTKVIATSTTGKRYHTKIKGLGDYRFDRLPPGVYRLTLVDECKLTWSIDGVTVLPGAETKVAETIDPHECSPDIIIGMLRVESDNG